MESGPTPHLEGVYGDYAPTVLLPGDPKRARFIAENYLTNIKLVNSVGGAEGFTGEFNGVPVSCLLYKSPSPRDATLSRMPSSA